MAIFKPFGSVSNTNAAPLLRREIVANSITITVGDSVKYASGFVALGTAAALVLGHVVSIGTNKGVGLNTTGVAGAEIGSFINSYLTTSTNQTVAKVRADLDVSKYTLYTNETSGTLGTTTGSNLAGYKLNLSDAHTLDETSALTTTLQYNSWGVNPIVSTQIIVNVYQSQAFGV